MALKFVNLHCWLLTLVGACLWLHTAARAEEPPHLDFVHGLRERGQPDLALEYLLRLKNQQTALPAEIKNALPLEIARCRQDVITREQNTERRAQLLKETRADLDAFVKNPDNTRHPSLADARLELAGLTLDEARRLLNKSHTAADAATRSLLNKDAIRLFDEASSAFENVAKTVEGQLKALPEPKDKKGRDEKQRLQNAFLNAQLNEAVASFEKSVILTGDVKKSGEAQQKAQKLLEDLANQRDQSPVGWIATAWLFRASIGLDNSKVENSYKRIIDEKKAEVLTAQRLVRYFVMLELIKGWRPDPNPKSPFKEQNIRVLAESWLKDYAKDANSPEGQHIRFLLGERYLGELQQVSEAQRQSTAAKDLADKALRIFDALAASHGEYSREAEDRKFNVLFLSGQARNKKIEELRTFEETLLRARIEVMEAVQAQAASREARAKADEERKLAAEAADPKEQAEHNKEADAKTKEADSKAQQIRGHIQEMLKSARRSLALMPENAKDEEFDQAFQLLQFGYTNVGDPYRAAVVNDYLALNARQPDHAKFAAVQALRIYQSLAAQDPVAARRLVSIAELMERKWPSDLETDSARDILGRDLMAKKKYREAAAIFEKVSERHPSYAASSYYGGVCYWVLHIMSAREAKKSLNSPSTERVKAIALLERSVKKYDEQKENADKKKEVQARLYLADEVYNRLGEYDKMLNNLKPLVTMVEKKELPADLPPQTDTKILSLVLKGHVQKKDLDGAKKILETLRKRGGEEGGTNSALTEQLVAVGKQIRSQISVLEGQGEAARDQLQDVKGSFREFLQQIEADPGLTPEIRSWIGSSFAGLGDHAKAISMFAAIKDPGDKASPQAIQNYHSALLMKTISQRQQAAAEARPTDRRKLFDQAEKDLADVMKNTWAKKHPAFQKEQIMLLQDQELYSGPKGAIAGWASFLKGLETVMQKNEVQQNPTRLKSFQEHYFDASYNMAYCMYKEAKQIQNKTKSDDAVKKAAERFNLLIHNENIPSDYKNRIEQFVQEHRDLKKDFDALNSKKSPSAG